MNSSKGPSECFDAQTISILFGNGETNPDVGGVAVAISNIVINLVLPILLRWAQDDVPTTVIMLLSQVYPIMIATAGSINSDNLSLFDAHFAVAVTASPVSVYLIYSSVRDLMGCPNALFRKLGSGKKIIRLLGLALPFLWLGVNLTISFSPRAFRNSEMFCEGMTIARWFEFQAVSNFVGVLDVMGRRDIWNDLQGRGGLGAISLAAMWIWAVYLVRHRQDILDDISYRRSKQTQRAVLTKIWLWIYNIFAGSWYVITKAHPWMVFVIIVCLHWSWILGIARGMTSHKGYQLSYGQIMSLFSTVPPILAVWNLLRRSREGLQEFFKSLPGSFWEGMLFLVSGSPNPWDVHPRRRMPLRPFHAPILEQWWLAVCIIWLMVTGLDIVWIIQYVHAGSIPNPRTMVNNPHSAWKPFSVAMYIYGYCVSYVNILIWTTFYDATHTISGKFGALITWCRERLSARQLSLVHSIKLTIIPFAFLMCVGPLFSPFAALPLAQEWQWTHFCDSFAGEVILKGATNGSIASFYFPSPDEPFRSTPAYSFDYTLKQTKTDNKHWQTLAFDSSSSRSRNQPDVLEVSYNVTEGSHAFQAKCVHYSGTYLAPGLCAYGNYSSSPYLSFSIRDSRTGNTTRLRAVDKEWAFSDDAPSVIVRIEHSDGTLGDIAIQSAVTQRNHCNTLKLCLPSRTLTLATLVPLGMIMSAQETYSEYCSRSRIYSL